MINLPVLKHDLAANESVTTSGFVAYGLRIQSELALPGRFVIRAGWGVYQQFADFEESVGAFAGSRLVPERSIHADLSVEHRLSPSTRYTRLFAPPGIGTTVAVSDITG